MFKNRAEAGKLLAKKLLQYKNDKAVVIGLARGGIPVAFEIAYALCAYLDVALVKKLGAPAQEELAIGAIVDGKNPQIFINNEIIGHLNITKDYIDEIIKIKLSEIRKREKIYRSGRDKIDIAGKIAIVVDDGIATGASIKVVIKSLKSENPKKIIVAVPVAPVETIAELKREVDEVIVLSAPENFYAVGAFYDDFSQTSDEEVISLLDKANENLCFIKP
ncbi:MAG: phosphoribosyltransferase [bacterium]